jgi:hypothetical protein
MRPHVKVFEQYDLCYSFRIANSKKSTPGGGSHAESFCCSSAYSRLLPVRPRSLK